MAESDEALIQAYGAGRREALGQLVQRRFEGAYRVALRALGDPGAAEDAACEAFAAVTRQAGRFEAGRAFGPWFTTILANAIRKQERSRQRRLRHEAHAAVGPFAPERDRDGPLDAERVGVALQALPLDLRLPLALHFQDGRTHAEVAAALGCPVGTASSRIRRGLEELRATLVGAAGALVPGSLESALSTPSSTVPAAPAIARLEALARGAQAARRVASALVLLLLAAAGAAWLAASTTDGPDVAPRAPASDAPSPARGGTSAAGAAGASAPGAPGSTDASGASRPEAAVTETPGSADAGGASAPRRVRRIVGRVVSEEGAPVGGARVIASREGDWTTGAEEDIDLAGRARAAASSPIESRVLRFRASRWRQPVEEAGRGQTGPDGRFELVVDVLTDGLAVGASTDSPLAVGHAALNTTEGLARLAAPGDTLDLGDVTLHPCRQLEVHVRSQGRPLAGADVHLVVPTSDAMSDDFWAHAATDVDGVARPVDPFGGAQLIVVAAPRHATALRKVEADDRVTVELAPAITTTARLLDPQGQPLSGVEGELHLDGESAWHVLVRARSSPDGTLVLPGLVAGAAYTLELESPRAGLLSRKVPFRAGPELTVTFCAPVEVRVVVTGPEPLEARDHVALQRRAPDGAWAAARQRTSHGPGPGPGVLDFPPDLPPEEVHLPDLEPGTYRAIAHAAGCATLVSAPFELAPGAPTRTLTLRLGPGIVARGRVLDAAGAPAAGIDVLLRVGDHEELLGTTGDDGVYETRQLPAGDVEATLVASELLGEKVVVPLGPDRTTLPDLVLPPAKEE